MLKLIILQAALTVLFCAGAAAQVPSSAAPAKPTEHLIGSITSLDEPSHTITVKDDKSGTETVISLADAKTVIKVPPGAKDLKTATRITADQLAVGDRVDIRGFKSSENAAQIAARSLVLMSARDLAAAHQAQAAEWQNSTSGVITSVDPSSGKITVNSRSLGGTQPLTITADAQTEFTRYSPGSPNSPAASKLEALEPGDQIRVIGNKTPDGNAIAAKRIYSGAFRTVNGTVISVAPDGKLLTIKDLASKKPLTVVITDLTKIRSLPPEIAAGLARRMASGGRPQATGNNAAGGGAPPPGTQAQGAPPSSSPYGAPPNGTTPHHGMHGGDISQMLDALPQTNLSDLTPGKAVVISGVLSGTGESQLTATNIISGVEPILQSAPAGQRGQTMGGDWGLSEMTAPQ